MSTCSVLLSFALACGASDPDAAPWPQFRGPNASGIAPDAAALPAAIGPESGVVWKAPVPPGHSSPVLDRERVYITAARGKDLLTIALDRRTGKVLWERRAPVSELEEIHKIGSHAQPSPATDGERVVSFFGSSGLLCYDPRGELLWSIPMGPFKNNFGAGSSPLIAGDRVILCQDHDTDSFILAVDKASGETIWRTDRSEFPRGFATPAIAWVGEERQVVAVGTLRIVAYDFESGKEIWTVRGLSRIACMTPVFGDDGHVYAAGYAPGGDDSDRIEADPWEAVVAGHDANGDELLEKSEIPEGPLLNRFDQIDRDKSGRITRVEYDDMRRIFDAAHNVVLSIDPRAEGDATATHVRWTQKRHVPYVPSPLYYKGHVYLVRNGGIVASLDAETGELIKEARVAGLANYYSSPVTGDGKIYLLSQRGELSVISAEPEWRELASTRFEEPAYATPALAGGRIYLRTEGHIYCFGREADGEEGEEDTRGASRPVGGAAGNEEASPVTPGSARG